jgi:hypothetical protein
MLTEMMTKKGKKIEESDMKMMINNMFDKADRDVTKTLDRD